MRYASILAAVLFLAACSSGDKSDKAGDTGDQHGSKASTTAEVDLSGTPVTLAGLKFIPPTSWNDLGPSGMRKGDYAFGPVAGDSDSATVTIFYFGPNMGGSIESNIDRWIGQISPAEDGSEPARESMEVDGMPVHIVRTAGSYSASMGGPMSGNSVEKPDYKLVGVVVEAPEGNVFFKLTGPEASADAMDDLFMAAIRNISRTS